MVASRGVGGMRRENGEATTPQGDHDAASNRAKVQSHGMHDEGTVPSCYVTIFCTTCRLESRMVWRRWRTLQSPLTTTRLRPQGFGSGSGLVLSRGADYLEIRDLRAVGLQ